jgi:hypothetical protein
MPRGPGRDRTSGHFSNGIRSGPIPEPVHPIDSILQGPSEGLFTEGAFVLVEGDYTDEEVLSVIAIGHPPSERRSVSR